MLNIPQRQHTAELKQLSQRGGERGQCNMDVCCLYVGEAEDEVVKATTVQTLEAGETSHLLRSDQSLDLWFRPCSGGAFTPANLVWIKPGWCESPSNRSVALNAAPGFSCSKRICLIFIYTFFPSLEYFPSVQAADTATV